jgi:Fe-S cluster biogenesis protein NfuA
VKDPEVRQRVEHVEALLERLPDDLAFLEAMQAVLELYGEGLRRMVERVGDAGRFDEDELVSHLLLLHDLHPVDVEARVAGALDEVRPYLGSHGGDVELLGIEDGVVHVRLDGSCHGCPSSTATLTNAIEGAIQRAAPEIERVEAEGAVEEPLLQIGSLVCPTELTAG